MICPPNCTMYEEVRAHISAEVARSKILATILKRLRRVDVKYAPGSIFETQARNALSLALVDDLVEDYIEKNSAQLLLIGQDGLANRIGSQLLQWLDLEEFERCRPSTSTSDFEKLAKYYLAQYKTRETRFAFFNISSGKVDLTNVRLHHDQLEEYGRLPENADAMRAFEYASLCFRNEGLYPAMQVCEDAFPGRWNYSNNNRPSVDEIASDVVDYLKDFQAKKEDLPNKSELRKQFGQQIAQSAWDRKVWPILTKEFPELAKPGRRRTP